MKKHFLRLVKTEDSLQTDPNMAEVLNMSIKRMPPYTDLNANALDLRKRSTDSPEILSYPKRFKYYSGDALHSQGEPISSAYSNGSLTPSPPSSLDYSLGSPSTPRSDFKFRIHAPTQWPLEATRGYSFNSMAHGNMQQPLSPNDLHARYSQFFDYAKNRFSLTRNHQEYRRISPPVVPPTVQKVSPLPLHGLANLNAQIGRSASLSPIAVQPRSPTPVNRPRSAENPAVEPKPETQTYTRTRSPLSQDRMSPVSFSPRASSSPLSHSQDASDSSGGSVSKPEIKRPIPSLISTAKIENTANLGAVYLDQVHPALALTDKIISAGVTGKPTRPFKAYPKDPLYLATSLAPLDPEELRYSQQSYYEFREKMLALTKSTTAQSYPKMKRSGSPGTESEVQDGSKDAQYWERRRKNNEAAKRSRDARKAKEDEIAIRAAYLENQNQLLTAEIKHLRFLTEQLRQLVQERSCSV